MLNKLLFLIHRSREKIYQDFPFIKQSTLSYPLEYGLMTLRYIVHCDDIDEVSTHKHLLHKNPRYFI